MATVGEDIELWDVARGERLRALEWTPGPYWTIASTAFSADGCRLASGLAPAPELYHQHECVETTLVWDTASGRQVHALRGDGGDVNPPSVDSVAFSPDGLIVAAGGANGSISLFDVATGERVRRLAVGWKETNALAFSPDGRALLSNGGLLDLAGHAKPHELKEDADDIAAVAFAPNGAIVATGSRDGTARLWDRWSGRAVSAALVHGAPVVAVAFLPDGSIVASQSDDGTVRMWHVASGQELVDGRRS
ncbi:MAG TPA: hypothetical protein VKX28_14510 [Xanthobacteraceae bacterium]|nr:hypothetical protein [Xanthobacteraceae bacterium]